MMNGENQSQPANIIWSICNLQRGPYKRNEYQKIILPLIILRHFDCLSEPTRQAAHEARTDNKTKPERVQQAWLQQVTGHRFYNLSRKVDYEIRPNRHSYRYEPPCELAEIEAEIKVVEGEIPDLLREVTA